MAEPDGSGPDDGGTSPGGGRMGGLRRRLAKALLGFDPLEIIHRLDSLESGRRALEQRIHEIATALQAEMEELRDRRVPAAEARLDGAEARLDGAEARLDGTEARLDGTEARLDGAEARLDGAEARLEGVEVRQDGAEARLEGVEVRQDGAEARLEGVEVRQDGAEARLDGVEVRQDGAEARLDGVEVRLSAEEEHHRGLQGELEKLRDTRVGAVERRLDAAERAASELAATVEELRDRRLPAAVRRGDVLLDRLAQQLEELASLVERMASREPLPLPEASPDERRLAEGLAEIQPRLLEVLRGPEDVISHRMEELLPLLEGHAPVLDLGCGRGELLGLLRERGMEATGVEADPALARGARRRGLRVVEGDVHEVLLRLGDGSAGAVTAVHLLEHLPVPGILKVLGEVWRVLRPGGVFLAECPNPASLRVGADEFWSDPTHVRPLPARLLELLLTASGFEVVKRRFLRPFPEDQGLPAVSPPPEAASPELGEFLARVDAMRRRLNELINGPRDYLLVARRSEQ